MSSVGTHVKVVFLTYFQAKGLVGKLCLLASVQKSSKIEFYGYFVNKIKMNRNLIIHTILAILALVLMITTAVLVPDSPEGCSYALINFTLIYAFILQILIMLYTLLVVLSNVVKEKYVKIYEFFLIAVNLIFCAWFLLVSFMVKDMCSKENFSHEFVGVFIAQFLLSAMWVVCIYSHTPPTRNYVVMV